MTTIKSFTSLEQSKKLAEILPLESSDMYYLSGDEYDIQFGSGIYEEIADWLSDGTPRSADIPCWSLAALLGVASTYCSRLEITLRADKKYNVFAVKKDFVFRSFVECSEGYNNPIDACYEMVLKLNELNLL